VGSVGDVGAVGSVGEVGEVGETGGTTPDDVGGCQVSDDCQLWDVGGTDSDDVDEWMASDVCEVTDSCHVFDVGHGDSVSSAVEVEAGISSVHVVVEIKVVAVTVSVDQACEWSWWPPSSWGLWRTWFPRGDPRVGARERARTRRLSWSARGVISKSSMLPDKIAPQWELSSRKQSTHKIILGVGERLITRAAQMDLVHLTLAADTGRFGYGEVCLIRFGTLVSFLLSRYSRFRINCPVRLVSEYHVSTAPVVVDSGTDPLHVMAEAITYLENRLDGLTGREGTSTQNLTCLGRR